MKQYPINSFFSFRISEKFTFKKSVFAVNDEKFIEAQIRFYTKVIELLNEYDKKGEV